MEGWVSGIRIIDLDILFLRPRCPRWNKTRTKFIMIMYLDLSLVKDRYIKYVLLS